MHRRSIIPSLIVLVLVVGATAAEAGPRIPTRLLRPQPAALVAAPHVAIGKAFSYTRKDPNDTKGPLDLASIRLVRGKRNDLLQWSTIDPVSNAAIDPDNGNFAIAFDVNDNQKYDYLQYVYYAGGRVRGVLVNVHTHRLVTRAIPTSRVNGTTFRQTLLPRKIASPGTYRFAVISYYQSAPCSKKHACVDGAPDRFPLFAVDHEAPSVTWGITYPYSSDARNDLKSPVSFTFQDDKFGTGVKTWLVQSRPTGTSAWHDVKRGHVAHPTVLVPGVQGGAYDVRIVVTDGQRNQTVSGTRRTVFPFDDANSAVFDTSASPVSWTSAPGAAAFLGTTSVGAQTATVDISWVGGDHTCLLGGPTTGTGQSTAMLDGVATVAPTDETAATVPMAQALCFALTGGAGTTHHLVVTVASADPYVIDGIVVVP